ncbi:Hypothetical protein RMHFA_04211a [Roseomonas mucosa]|nr:Hypothetical protein RMHFA_04211a [Roseomonas mucosa]
MIPGNRWRGGAPEKKKDTLSTLAAPAARRRAMLSGVIRRQRAPTHRVQGPQGPGG